jgi:hypothetical protein
MAVIAQPTNLAISTAETGSVCQHAHGNMTSWSRRFTVPQHVEISLHTGSLTAQYY